MSRSPSPPAGRRFSWPLAFAIVGLTLVLVSAGVGLYLFDVLRRAPAQAIDHGKELARELQEIARAFTTATITTSFVSYATEVSGSTYLQFATLNQMEVFEREDRASTLWGSLELPEVVVEARAPVQYTYYLDLDEDWTFELEEDRVQVLAPGIAFNRPSIDPSLIEYEVRTGSLFRDEDEALEKLRRGLSALAHRRAQENVALVRELGRRQTAEFVENWLLKSFGDASKVYRVEVRFADEVAPAFDQDPLATDRPADRARPAAPPP